MSDPNANIGADQKPKEPVDRGRRFKYIAWVTAFCLISAFLVTMVGWWLYPAAASPLLDLYVRGVLGIASATVLAYVSGSVIDYNGGIGKLFSTQPKG